MSTIGVREEADDAQRFGDRSDAGGRGRPAGLDVVRGRTRTTFVVTSTDAGDDDAPGDGVCTSAAAAGACTFRAAVQEANATSSGVDVVVGPGSYHDPLPITVTGDIRVNADARRTVILERFDVTVAAGARLELHGVWSDSGSFWSSTSFDVAGTLHLEGADVNNSNGALIDGTSPVLRVRPGGAAIVVDSAVHTVRNENGNPILNEGVLILMRSTVTGVIFAPSVPADRTVLETTSGATTVMAASGIHADPGGGFAHGAYRCAGVPPVSLGHNRIQEPCGGTQLPTDQVGAVPGWTSASGADASSPIVDAIPLGDEMCDGATVDVVGTVRGNDGDGDGVPGCDIGAVERVP